MTARHTAIVSSLQGLSPKLRFWLRCLGAFEVLLALSIWIAASLAVDWLFELPLAARIVLMGALAAVSVLLVLAARRRLRRQFEMAELAAVVETSTPELDGHLLNVLELPGEIRRLSGREGSVLESRLLGRALEESCGLASRASFAGTLNVVPVLQRGGLLAATLVGVIFIAAQSPAVFGLWFRRNVLFSSELWPRQTHFFLDRDGEAWHHARKDALEISGWVAGVIPRQVVLRLSSEGSQRDVLVMPGAIGNPPAGSEDPLEPLQGRRLVYTIPSLTEPLEFHFRGGDNESRSVTVHVHDRPRILATRFTSRFPAYLKLEPRSVENPGADVSVPAGTVVELEAQADQDLASGWFRFGAGERQAAQVEGKTLRAQFLPKENGFLDVGVVEETYQFESDPPLRIAFVVLPDRAPSVTLAVEGEGRVLTPQGRIRYRAAAEDDHGFSDFSLKTWLRPQGEVKTDDELEPKVAQLEGPLETTENGVRSAAEGEISIAALGLATGSSLTLQAFTSDNDTLSGPKTASSQKETFQVIDPEEFRKEMDKVRLEAQALLEGLSKREEVVAQEIARATEKSPEDPGAKPTSPAAAKKTSSASGARSAKSQSAPSESAEASSSDASTESAESPSESSPSKSQGSKSKSKASSKKSGAKTASPRNAKPKDSGAKEAEPKDEPAPDAVASEEKPQEDPAGSAGETADPKTANAKSSASRSSASKSSSSRPSSPQPSTPENGQTPPQQAPEEQTTPDEGFQKLAEEQSRIGKEASQVSQKLRQMADALRRNSLLEPAEERRFNEEVSKPLEELAEERLPESASEIESLPNSENAPEQASTAQRRAEKMSDEMKRVAEKLAGTGDFREILQRLELIIDLQKKTIGETEKHIPAEPNPEKERSK